MLEVLTRLFCTSLMSVYGFYIIKKVTKSNNKILNLKNISLLVILSVTTIFLYQVQYQLIYTVTVFALNIIIYKMIFNLKVDESLIACGILMFLTFIGDLTVTSIFRQFFSAYEMREIYYVYIITNILVVIIGEVLIKIKFVLRQLQNFYINIRKKRSLSNILFLILLIVGLSSLTYNIARKTITSIDYIIDIVVMVIFFYITYIFIKSKNSYNQLSTEYDSLFSYIQNFEEWIEKEQLNHHEYKNQLAVLRCLTTEKKVKNKIDEILEDDINIEGEVVHQLKTLPKGGIKGLMYYKAAIAQKNKINLVVTTSIEEKSILNTLTEQEIRVICKLIGIYFDNAIEAAKETRKKSILIEIYEFSNRVNFVFSNTFKQHKNFNDRNKKGVSTKGEGRGNGLYFASKLISKNEWIEEKQEVIDKYYIQQLIIKRK